MFNRIVWYEITAFSPSGKVFKTISEFNALEEKKKWLADHGYTNITIEKVWGV